MAEKDEAMVGNRKFKELSPREQDQWMLSKDVCERAPANGKHRDRH